MLISEKLNQLNLISGNKISMVFDELYSDILTISYSSESAIIKELWARFTSTSPSINGNIFEGILAVIFFRSSILPLYVQAKISFAPNVDFDFVAYTREIGPIILSAKTSLRERYKQADLEGMMLRQVHRRSKSYLITLNEVEANNVNKKIKQGQVLGLDRVIVAHNETFDQLIAELKTYNYYRPEKIDILTSSRLIV